MAIGIYFSPESFPVDKYDSTLKDLENAGAGAPAGRLYHVAMESPGGVHVFDIWESKEAFEAFGATLLPILSAAGVDPGEPMISEVHNVITAQATHLIKCVGDRGSATVVAAEAGRRESADRLGLIPERDAAIAARTDAQRALVIVGDGSDVRSCLIEELRLSDAC